MTRSNKKLRRRYGAAALLVKVIETNQPQPYFTLGLGVGEGTHGFSECVEGVMQLATVDSYSSKWVEVEPTRSTTTRQRKYWMCYACHLLTAAFQKN